MSAHLHYVDSKKSIKVNITSYHTATMSAKKTLTLLKILFDQSIEIESIPASASHITCCFVTFGLRDEYLQVISTQQTKFINGCHYLPTVGIPSVTIHKCVPGSANHGSHSIVT
jgi:hypothetical protein